MIETHDSLATVITVESLIPPPEERIDTGIPFNNRAQRVIPENALNTLLHLPQDADPELKVLVDEYSTELYGMSLSDISDAIEQERSAIQDRLKDISLPIDLVNKLNTRVAALELFEQSQVVQNFTTWLKDDPKPVYAIDGAPLNVLTMMQQIHGDNLTVSSVWIENTSKYLTSGLSSNSELNEQALAQAKAYKKVHRSPGNPSIALIARMKAQIIDNQVQYIADRAIAANTDTTLSQQIQEISSLYSETQITVEASLPSYVDITTIDGTTRQKEAEAFFKQVFRKKSSNTDPTESIVYLVKPSTNPDSYLFAVGTGTGYVSIPVSHFKQAVGLHELRMNHQDHVARQYRLEDFNRLLGLNPDTRYENFIVVDRDFLRVTIDTSVSTLAPDRKQPVTDFINAIATRSNLRMRYLVSPYNQDHLEIILPDKRTLRVSVAEWQHALGIEHIPVPGVQDQAEETQELLKEYFQRFLVEDCEDVPSIGKITVAAEARSDTSHLKTADQRAATQEFFEALDHNPVVTMHINGQFIDSITCNGSGIDPRTFSRALGMKWKGDNLFVRAITVDGITLVKTTTPVAPAISMLRINGIPVTVRVTSK